MLLVINQVRIRVIVSVPLFLTNLFPSHLEKYGGQTVSGVAIFQKEFIVLSDDGHQQ